MPTALRIFAFLCPAQTDRIEYASYWWRRVGMFEDRKRK
jgi:hypothetical protein